MSVNLFAGRAVPAMNTARLSAGQWQYLMLLYVGHLAHDPDPLHLSTHSRSESAAQSRMLRRLEERGYVLRIAEGPSHYRTTGVVLTAAGLRFMEAITGPPDPA